MKMIATPAAAAISQYPAYVHNCLRNAACEPSYTAPLPSVPHLQLYVDFGQYKPVTVEFHLQDTCDPDHEEQIFPSNYVVGQTPEGNWYGVFKYFNSPVTPVTTFVVWLSALVDTPAGLLERTFFSEMLIDEPCAQLTKVKACLPEGATTTGFDINGLYYGLPVNEDFLGQEQIRYFHIGYVRYGKVREMANKATFSSSLYRTFRSSLEKIWQLETELVPKWYKDYLLAIYMRGAVQINDGTTYLVSELAFEGINDDDLIWKPWIQLKGTFRQYFGCDDSECVECCSPIVLDAYTTFEEDSTPDSGSGGDSEGPLTGFASISNNADTTGGTASILNVVISGDVPDGAVFPVAITEATGGTYPGAPQLAFIQVTVGAGGATTVRVIDSFGSFLDQAYSGAGTYNFTLVLLNSAGCSIVLI